MTGFLTSDDAAWFRDRPHRQFQCRYPTAAERADDESRAPAEGLTRLVYVRRGDGETAAVWTRTPQDLLAEQDEARARLVFEVMQTPDAFDPGTSIDFDAIAAPVEESVRALADDALARGVIAAERHRAIIAEPEAHVLPRIDLANDGRAGSGVQITAHINPKFLAEIGLPERES